MRRSMSQKQYQNPLVNQPDSARTHPMAAAQVTKGGGGVESMSDLSSEEVEEEVGVLIAAKDVALKPLKVAVSKPAQRVYLNTALLAIVSLFFLGTAITAYLLLYYTYIPNRGFSRPIHLQYDANRYPYGSVQLARELVSDQPYDINVILHLPRTPSNKHAGNFMLSLDLLAPRDGSANFDPSDRSRIVVSSRRPTILPYHSEIMEAVRKVTGLAWYLLGWKSESEILKVTMLEGTEFGRGWRMLPTVANVEIQSEKDLQIYSVIINFTARLRGLRYLMYNWRVTSFITFVTSFWTLAMGLSTSLWAIATFVFAPSATHPHPEHPEYTKPRPKSEVKSEYEEAPLSDTERTFPSTSRAHPLRYTAPKIKKEEEEDIKPVIADIPQAVEADVEDEDEDEDMDFVSDELARGAFHDSGIGTSMDSGVEKGKDRIRKRTGRGSGSRERR